jgi:hypothetical protein
MKAMAMWCTLAMGALPVYAAEEGHEAAHEPAVHEVHGAGEAHEGHAGHEAEHEEELETEFSADLVLGLTTFDAWTPAVNAAGEQVSAQQSTRLWTGSLMLGLEREVGHEVSLGLRIPVVLGRFDVLDGPGSRGTGPVLGNLELEASHRTRVSEHAHLDLTFELALPTGFGSEPPAEREAELAAADPVGVDQGTLLKAASFARGQSDSSLFEARRIGFIPKATFTFDVGPVKVKALAKFEALADVTGKAPEPLLGELVLGLRGALDLHSLVEPTLSVWTNLTLTRTEEQNVNIAAVEPGVQFRLGRVVPMVGVVVPFAGRLAADHSIGVRAGVVAAF